MIRPFSCYLVGMDAPQFRLYLKAQLAERQGRNPRYSLRSFARFLEIDSSALSKIMNGKRALGQKMMQRMGERLQKGPQSEGLPALRTLETDEPREVGFSL
ncbi:MAG: hypothetical protein A2X86_00670 [Bdellovibrionales bacterium GWA2_49_15]|nr:MAG: hypothetical protein A2X86_00670 [Bdellovibrionales bacterium GWA2_49_15]HAZ13222.1 hypothetical protein [Bdellovibrionales bacterium]